VVHGDFHNENVIFKGGKAKWIIDLDDVRFGWSGEDVVTFAIFSGGGGCFTLSGITHAKPLFEYFIKYSKATREEMSLSIDATLLRLALSFRLEEWVLKDSSSQAINLINRDLIKYRLFISNYDAIHEAWACV
jgi:Ser/Thr protein kinase RdoA (MazF antagonist)